MRHEFLRRKNGITPKCSESIQFYDKGNPTAKEHVSEPYIKQFVRSAFRVGPGTEIKISRRFGKRRICQFQC